MAPPAKLVALITEGTHGLGKQFALNLLRVGANVTILGKNEEVGIQLARNTNRSNRQFNNRLTFMKCDIHDTDELCDMFDRCNKKHGPLNIICNNTCGNVADESSVSEQITKSLTSLIEGTYKGLDLMRMTGGGKGGVIINVPPIEYQEDLTKATVNRATKFGMVGFTRSFKYQYHLAFDSIRVNCLCPIYSDPNYRENEEDGEVEEQSGNVKSIEYGRYDDMLDAFMACIKNKELNGEVIVAKTPITQY